MGEVAQSVDLEFKPQYYKKKKIISGKQITFSKSVTYLVHCLSDIKILTGHSACLFFESGNPIT
jgi:hypothetical protein